MAAKIRQVPIPETRGDAGERAYVRLRDAIVSQSLAPGQRLVESALCEWLQMSRTPVRAALGRLQAASLVEEAPGGGLQVASYDLGSLNELYVVREMLEATAASEAARHATPAEIAALQDSLEIQRRLVNDVPAFARENVLFHQYLYAAAHNRFLLRTLQTMGDAVALLGRTAIDQPEAVERAIGQHAKIVAAIVKRDPERAFELTRQHIRTGLESRSRAFRRGLVPVERTGK
jgi:DNA-binding GntR family transcriptional regulator